MTAIYLVAKQPLKVQANEQSTFCKSNSGKCISHKSRSRNWLESLRLAQRYANWVISLFSVAFEHVLGSFSNCCWFFSKPLKANYFWMGNCWCTKIAGLLLTLIGWIVWNDVKEWDLEFVVRKFSRILSCGDWAAGSHEGYPELRIRLFSSPSRIWWLSN